MAVPKICLRAAVAVIALLLVVRSPAIAAGDVAAGKTLAATWCTSCHIVAPDLPGKDTAPPFATIAARTNRTPDSMRAWLTDPHPPMQNLSLSRQQIDDIVSYIESLRPR